jgi:CRISPR/Cas system-associated exonuclease Cas4 (RecB family)
MALKGREEMEGVNVSDEAFDEPPSKISLPKKYLSASQVSMYLKCPRQYKFRYVDDHKRPPGISAAMGTSGHKACETTHHHIVDHDVPASDEEVTDSFSDKWNEVVSGVEEMEGLDPGTLKDQGIALVRMYNQQIAPQVKPQVNEDNVRGVEMRFEVDVAGVPMLGFIDLIDENSPIALSPEEAALIRTTMGPKWVPNEVLRTAVSDLKFKGKASPQSEVDGSLQLTLYSLATGIYAVRYDQLIKTKTPKIKRATSMRTKQDHKWLQHIVREVAEAISKGAFPPTDPTSWACNPKWCGYYSQCRGKKR